ncbi:tetratricopeptide repeat protein [Massilia sp. 9096]|uniref:tetratricopeptide repeat protein n=1 Tax=Massilia sp. 9096 TaxID=1500894 RepID=UPI00068C416E|nr:tetratricopeptide repeat protein [Massilia sp. 9096]
MTKANALLQQAVHLHQQGRLEPAQDLYRQVLLLEPRQFDALHLLGVIERQRGRAREAVALIEAALQVDGKQARAHCNLGAALQDLGQPERALASYDSALRLDPHYALAWNNRGNTLRRLGRPQEALDAYERALTLRANDPDAWCHRAIVLLELGRPADAAASAERALAARPDWPEALLALGNALQALDRLGDAVKAYDRALAQDKQDERADLWCARGAALKKSGRLDDALASYDRALAARPDYALATHYRANVLRALGRRQEAVDSYRRALELGADGDEIRFALAALGEADAPAGAPQAYVKELFDQYAGHFDRHLVEVLGYRTPALLGALLARHGLAAGELDVSGTLDVLDLGCGTGLCATMLRPLARRLGGVDLSGKMLDKARELQLYDQLDCAEIGAYLDGQQAAWDLMVAADVLVYFGDLAPLFEQIRKALRPGGRFAFSCETPEAASSAGDGTAGKTSPAGAPRGYAITASNRYAHARAYVEATAHAAGFDLIEAEAAALRREHGVEVAGQLFLLRARSAS